MTCTCMFHCTTACINNIGYSNGNIGDVSKSSIDHGGQCTEGLKMVVLIGEDASSPGV